MEDLVSVVVPVYNSEKYLRDCVESIVNQTYRNLDIILVDDGSTDSSGNICEEYAGKDNRVTVLHKENGGNGDARNAGYKCAKGKWLVMVDNDDLLHLQQIEILVNIANEKNADVVIGNYRAISDDEIPGNNHITQDVYQKAEILTSKHLHDNEFIKKRSMILTTPWSKIWRKSLYENIQFPKKSKHDDTWTTWKAYEKAEKVVFVDEVVYYWRNNPESFGRIFNLSHLEGIDAYAEQLDYFIEKKKQRYIEIVFAEYLEMFFWCYNRMQENDMEMLPLQPYLKKIRKVLHHLKVSKNVSFLQWIKYYYLAYFKIPKIIKN